MYFGSKSYDAKTVVCKLVYKWGNDQKIIVLWRYIVCGLVEKRGQGICFFWKSVKKRGQGFVNFTLRKQYCTVDL